MANLPDELSELSIQYVMAFEDQTPSWIQSEEERPSFSATTPTFKHGYNTKVISEVLT